MDVEISTVYDEIFGPRTQNRTDIEDRISQTAQYVGSFIKLVARNTTNFQVIKLVTSFCCNSLQQMGQAHKYPKLRNPGEVGRRPAGFGGVWVAGRRIQLPPKQVKRGQKQVSRTWP